MATLTHLPHVLNVQAGANKWDPVNNAVYEVYFTLPDGIKAEFAADEAILTEQVISVSGLNGLDKTTGEGKQTFLGASVSFQEPVINDTFIEFTIEFNLNLRNKTDNFVHKLFRAWEQLNYNLADVTRTLKSQYCSDSFRVSEANRDGSIHRSFALHHVLLCEVNGADTLDYTNNEARKLSCRFRADYWEEVFAGGTDVTK